MAELKIVTNLDARLIDDGILDPGYRDDYQIVHSMLNDRMRQTGKILTEENFQKGETALREWLITLFKQGASQEKLTSYLRCGLAHLCFDFIDSTYDTITADDLVVRSMQSFKLREFNKTFFKAPVLLRKPAVKKTVKKTSAKKAVKKTARKTSVKKAAIKKSSVKAVKKKSAAKKSVNKAAKKTAVKKTVRKAAAKTVKKSSVKKAPVKKAVKKAAVKKETRKPSVKKSALKKSSVKAVKKKAAAKKSVKKTVKLKKNKESLFSKLFKK